MSNSLREPNALAPGWKNLVRRVGARGLQDFIGVHCGPGALTGLLFQRAPGQARQARHLCRTGRV